MNLRNVSINRSPFSTSLHFTLLPTLRPMAVCVRPDRGLWTATPPITLRAFPTTTGLRKKRSTKRPQQPPSSLQPTSSLSSQNRKCDSLPSSLSPFLFPSLPADSAAERSTRPRPSLGRLWGEGGRRRSALLSLALAGESQSVGTAHRRERGGERDSMHLGRASLLPRFSPPSPPSPRAG